jgi:hypothetical protein
MPQNNMGAALQKTDSLRYSELVGLLRESEYPMLEGMEISLSKSYQC